MLYRSLSASEENSRKFYSTQKFAYTLAAKMQVPRSVSWGTVQNKEQKTVAFVQIVEYKY